MKKEEFIQSMNDIGLNINTELKFLFLYFCFYT